MLARARIVAEADGRGGTRLSTLRCESPLLFRRTGPVTLHLVGGAAGPLRGDELNLEIEVGPDARLDLRSVAASLALPGRPGLPPSRLTITATVGTGGRLRWLPEPLIAAAGCDHRTVTHVDVAAGGHLLWRDDLVCGRHSEDPGDVRAETTIRYAGRPLYRHDLSAGPNAPGWQGAAVLGGARAYGSLLLVGPHLPDAGRPPGEDAAVMALAGPGLLASAVGADIRQIRRTLDPLIEQWSGNGTAERPETIRTPAAAHYSPRTEVVAQN